MKKLLINICLLLLTVGLSCCYKDKGNYDYSSLPQPVISGIPETCTAYVNTQLQIPVTLEWPDGELKDVSYEWRVNNKVISTQKDLDVVITLDVKPSQRADFSVIDNESGVRTMKTFVMNVTTELAAGWFVLSNESDYSNLSFIREGDGLLYNNIYETANGEKLTKGVTVIKEHWLPWSEATGEVFIGVPHGPNYSLDLDGNSLKRIVYTKDEFLEGMPDNFAPTNMECVMNWDYLFSNGKLYKRYVERGSDANYNEGKFVRMPEPGDYELSNLTLRGNLVFSTDIIAFDLKTKSYKLIRNGEMQDFNYKNDSGKKFNPNNMGKTLIAGGVTSTDTPTDKFITILKGDDVKWRYKATGCSPDYQFRLYKPGEFESQKDYVVANIWDWDRTYTVNWYEDGVLKGAMQAFDDEDQDYINMVKGKKTGYHTRHLFRAQPAKGTKSVKVVVKNRFGEVFTKEVKL